jgi:hypothetical protein
MVKASMSYIGERHLGEHLLVLISFLAFIVMQHLTIWLYFDASLLTWIANSKGVSTLLTFTYILFVSFVSLFVRHLAKERSYGEKGFTHGTKDI